MRSRTRALVYRYLNEELSDDDFKEQISKLLRIFAYNLVYQDIGLVVWAMEAPYRLRPSATTPLIVSLSLKSKAEQFKKIWLLLDEIEPRIKKDLTHWLHSMS